MGDFQVTWGTFRMKIIIFGINGEFSRSKWGIFEKMGDFCINGGFLKRKQVIFVVNGGFSKKQWIIFAKMKDFQRVNE